MTFIDIRFLPYSFSFRNLSAKQWIDVFL